MIQDNPLNGYFVVSQKEISKILLNLNESMLSLVNSDLDYEQQDTLQVIIDQINLINSLYEQQVAHGQILPREDFLFSFTEIEEVASSCIEKYKNILTKRNITIKTKYKLISRTILTDEQIIKDIINTVITLVLTETKDIEVSILVQDKQINQFKSTLKISVLVPNNPKQLAPTDYISKTVEVEGFDGFDKSITINNITQELKKLKGKTSITDHNKDVVFSFELPFFTFNISTNNPNQKLAKSLPTSNTQEESEYKIPINVLLVDDSRFNREIIKGNIENEDYIIDEAENGREALKKFLQQDYDIIVADIHMPEMNGITLVSQIRSQTKQNDIPVIGITGDKATQLEIEFKEIEGTELLYKPLNHDELIEKIKKYALKIAFFDEDEVKKSANNSKPLEIRLQKLFLKEINEIINETSEAEDMYDAIHKLVSSSAYCGYMQTQRRAQAVENSIQKGLSKDIISHQFRELKRTLVLTKNHLQSRLKENEALLQQLTQKN